MNEKLMRAAEAHDEATAAFADIFGEGLANNWFRQTQLILKEQLNKAGLLASDAGFDSAQPTEEELDAIYKRMQDEAAAELDRLAPKAPKVEDVATDEEEVAKKAEEEAAKKAEEEAAKQAEEEAAKKAEEEAAKKAEEEAAKQAASEEKKTKAKPEAPTAAE